MASGRITDEQLSASSRFTRNNGAENARLTLSGVWNPTLEDPSPWLQVDFLENVAVSEISTQGSKNYNQWVKTYNVSFSYDGTNFHFCEQNGQIKVGS